MSKKKEGGTKVVIKASKYTEQMFLSLFSLEADY